MWNLRIPWSMQAHLIGITCSLASMPTPPIISMSVPTVAMATSASGATTTPASPHRKLARHLKILELIQSKTLTPYCNGMAIWMPIGNSVIKRPPTRSGLRLPISNFLAVKAVNCGTELIIWRPVWNISPSFAEIAECIPARQWMTATAIGLPTPLSPAKDAKRQVPGCALPKWVPAQNSNGTRWARRTNGKSVTDCHPNTIIRLKTLS